MIKNIFHSLFYTARESWYFSKRNTLHKLEQMGLCIDNQCGQGYDSGSIVRGEVNDMQNRMLNTNLRPFLSLQFTFPKLDCE